MSNKAAITVEKRYASVFFTSTIALEQLECAPLTMVYQDSF